MELVTLATVRQAKLAAGNSGLPATMVAARDWLRGCPRKRVSYESDEAWQMAQAAALRYRLSKP